MKALTFKDNIIRRVCQDIQLDGIEMLKKD